MATLFGYFFGLTALQHLLKPARNAFFLSTAGAENLPWAYIGSAVASVPAMLAYGRWIAPLSRERLIFGSQATILVSLIAFWALLRSPTAWIAGAFYVWFNVFSLFLVSQFYLLSNELFDPRQAKRIFGLIGAGGLAGGIAGAGAAGFLANEIGSENLLWIGAGLLVACGAFAIRLFRVGRFRPTRPTGGRERGKDITGGFSVVRRLPHLRRIAVLLFLTIVASTFVDWIYNSAVEAAHPGDPERQAEFIGQSFAIFNSIAFVIQISATSLALRVLGLTGALLLLPTGVALGATSVMLIPSIWTGAVAKGADASLRYSIDQAAREILFLPVPTPLKKRAKPFIDIVVQRAADGVAGTLILLGGGLAALTMRGLAVMTLIVAGLWIAWVWRVRGSYQSSLERLLAVRDVDLEAAVESGLDSRAIRDLREELRPEVDGEQVRLALDLLSELPPGVLREEARRLLGHPDPEVRTRAIELLEPGADPATVAAIRPLTGDPVSRVRARATLFLCRNEPGHDLPGELDPETLDPYALEAALTCLIETGDEEDEGRAGRLLSRFVHQVGDSAAPMRAACARALGRLPGRHPLQRHLETLLADRNHDVVMDALRAAIAIPRRDLIPSILPHLRSPATRSLAWKALSAHGEEGIPFFAAALRNPELPVEVRRWIPGVFVRLGTHASYVALLEGLPFLPVGKHRLYALKALNKMRRRHADWIAASGLVRDEIDRELLLAYETQRMIATAEAIRREPGGPSTKELGIWRTALEFLSETAVERAFRLQGLLYRPRTMYFAYVGLTGGDTVYSANALELLETALEREDAARLLPLIDPDRTPAERAAIGRSWYGIGERDLEADLEATLEGAEPWLQAYAAELAGSGFAERLGPELERLAAAGPEMVRPIARRALQPPGGDDMPMSPVEKAAALRESDLLAELGADDLLQLAAVAEERSFESDEYLFFEGEEGDYLYVLLEGQVRVEREGQEVFTAGPGETIGTFSILDRRPRSASAIAVGEVRTLAIHRADMGQILADNYSLVEDLFGHLTGIIREMNELVYSRGSHGGEPPEEPAEAAD